jgi:putative ABC transport system permease protein
VLIVLVAASNFVSMMTARAARRAVEVGVRKALGATRSQLIVQFMGECVLYSVLALAIAVFAVELILPGFNTFLQRDLEFDLFQHPLFGTAVFATAVMIGLAAGVYPALVSSMFGPATVLRGLVWVPWENPVRVRQLLVTLQLATLIALLASTLTIYSQAQYALQGRLHFPTDQIYVVDDGCRAGFKESVARLPGVLTAACVSDPAMEFVRIGTTLATGNLHKVSFRLAPVDGSGFFDEFGVVPLAGRLFAPDRDEDNLLREDSASPSNPSIILNETGARALGYATPAAAVGQFVTWQRGALIDGELSRRDSLSSRIIAVVADFPIGSVRNAIEPTVYYVDPAFSSNLVLRLDGHAVAQTLRAVTDLWDQRSGGLPLGGVFLSQHVEFLYADIRRQSLLFWAFSGVAVVISALGLLGLASFTAEARTREIGLRKVMGASRFDVLRFLGWEFARPVLWANLIAWPLAYGFMRRWLESFAYHIEINLLTFMAAGLFALVIAAATVAGYAYLVARSHPAGALRHE